MRSCSFRGQKKGLLRFLEVLTILYPHPQNLFNQLVNLKKKKEAFILKLSTCHHDQTLLIYQHEPLGDSLESLLQLKRNKS